jgi:hypothetical protein
MVARDRNEVGRGVGGGIAAGLMGGLAMAVFMLLVNIAKGADVWVGMKMAGAPFLGQRAMEPGFDLVAVFFGVLSHFFVSAIWGALFGLLAFGLRKSTTILFGLGWGIAVWIGMFYIVLPILGFFEISQASPVGLAVFEHVLFGGVVGLGFLPFQREVPHARAMGTAAHPT